MTREIKSAFDPEMWRKRVEGGYSKLGWVNASEPLQKMIELADLKGSETILDVGTGNQIVADSLGRKLNGNGKVYGFDISAAMLASGSKEIPLFVADAYRIPLPEASVDLVTARMVYHHLERPGDAIIESQRVLKTGGKLVICEYVAPDPEVWEFERGVFDIKEPLRNLWTGEQLTRLVDEYWESNETPLLDYAVMSQYSVRDWMGKSGLSEEVQDAVLSCYLKAPDSIRKKMGINYTEDGDALVNRPFAFVVAVK